MNGLRMTALHADFGVEVHDVDLRELSPTYLYPEIRGAFEEHSLLVFRNQRLDNDDAHLTFGSLWGPIEDRAYGAMGDAPRMDNVTNKLADNTLAAADDLHTLNLMGNQLWHTDSTFLPVPALANILAARVLSNTGGETEFVSTRAAWRDMPAALRDRIDGRVIRHRLAHSRAKISPVLAEQHRAKWPDQTWPAIWTNPVSGADALYIASHSCGIEGMADDEAQPLLEELIDFCTQPDVCTRMSGGWAMCWSGMNGPPCTADARGPTNRSAHSPASASRRPMPTVLRPCARQDDSRSPDNGGTVGFRYGICLSRA